MAIRPLDDLVVIRVLEAEETTAGGIVLPDTAQEKPQRGKVVATGNGKLADDGKRMPLELSKGDLVIFGKYSGADVKVADDEFKIMRESDVLARVEG
jgi:chaperonin GroES